MACKVARRSLCGVALYQLVPVADLQIFDDLLYVLCAVLGTDQNGIVSVYHDQIFHAHCCDQTLAAANGAAFGADRDDIALDIVALFIGRVDAFHCQPVSHIVPAEAARQSVDVLCLFHDTEVNGLAAECVILGFQH